MALTINTNISSLIAQRNFNNATNSLNLSIEKMTTGYKINHAADNAAGYSISNMWVTQLGSLDIASDNAATGADMLSTTEETYSLLTGHLQRVRDLTEQAANGTYGSQSLKAIHSEISARFEEITRIASNAEFNGIKLMSFVKDAQGKENDEVGLTGDLNLQVGLYANENSQIKLSIDLFTNATVSGLFKSMLTGPAGSSKPTLATQLTGANASYNASSTRLNSTDGIKTLAAACSGLKVSGDNLYLQTDGYYAAKEMLKYIDNAINDISKRVTSIGSAQNRVSSAISALDVQSQNLTSSLSTLRDTDIAEESSNFIQAQILQQASATLLSTANQLPSVALNLI